jgi:AcrR family transcriptional regulator
MRSDDLTTVSVMAESEAATQQPRRRRTQQERRAATRAALLDATIECLIEYGYAGVTTTKIVERAGVSRGAQVHHFPTKAQLVADAVAHLANRMSEELAAEVATVPSGARRLDAVLDLLWQTHSGPLFQAALELWVAARTDVELRGHLVALERDINAAIRRGSASLFGDFASGPSFRGNVEVALATMRGLALIYGSNGDTVERRWQEARKRLKFLFTEDLARA